MTLITKTQLMDSVIPGGNHESFEHSTMGTFDVTLTRAWAKLHCRPQRVSLVQIIPFITASRVTEPERVLALTEESWRVDPGILITLGDGGDKTHLMIDGHHRALRRAREGELLMLFYIIPLANAIRPSPGWVNDARMDWGDDIKEGKIIKR